MEFLRDEDKVESRTETSNDKTDFGAEAESKLGDPAAAVELETAEAWPDQQNRNKKESSDKWLKWIQVIGG